MEQNPLSYRVEDASKLLGLSRAKLYEEIKAERLHVIKVGARTLISRRELERYVAALELEANRQRSDT